jgi:hypothetical protein
VFVEWLKILLPTGAGVLLGWLLLRRLEEVKSEVARRSDYSRQWADLFFETSHTFIVSVERLMTFYQFLSNAADPNDRQGMEWQQQANALLPVLLEHYFRIQRLVLLARSRGSAAEAAATRILESTEKLTKTRTGNLGDLRREIDAFNQAVREAHSEMLASRTS